ncbi:MAG: DUF2073 domain-containing protein [Thermoplasmata archaeon]|nr:DUF2073 domain-containing protein [Thermoplasmata archaeon]
MVEKEEGIEVNLLSRELLRELKDKVGFILQEIKKGKVMVLEEGLTAEEQVDLIQRTMREIDQDSFIGVEAPGFHTPGAKMSFLAKLLRRTPPPRMMVIGPAKLLKTIKKDGRSIQALIVTKTPSGNLSITPPEEAERVLEGEEEAAEEVSDEGRKGEEPLEGEILGGEEWDEIEDEM